MVNAVRISVTLQMSDLRTEEFLGDKEVGEVLRVLINGKL